MTYMQCKVMEKNHNHNMLYKEIPYNDHNTYLPGRLKDVSDYICINMRSISFNANDTNII